MRRPHAVPAFAGSRVPAALSLCVALVLADVPLVAGQGGAGAGQRAGGQDKPATAATGRVRVPTSHANVHASPSTGAVLLVMAPKGTTLTVTGRDKEWVQVELSPELRRTGLVVRWYNNENRGWMHDSTVEVIPPKPSPDHANGHPPLGVRD